jgi:hypothetical protein
VRSRPNGAILGALHNGTRVIVTDSTVASGKVWSVVPVEAGKVGWVFRSYLDCAWASRWPSPLIGECDLEQSSDCHRNGWPRELRSRAMLALDDAALARFVRSGG